MTDVVNIDNTQVILDVQNNNVILEVLPQNSISNILVENTYNNIDIYQASGTIEISAGESIQGPKGDKGDAAATILVGSTTTGAAGSSASVTNSGTSSNVVLNFTVPVGNTGAQGAQGIQGLKGDTGLTGATGATGAQGIEGLKGDTGSQGLKGDTGDTGPQGIQGIKGDTGNQGLQGIQGIQGEQGIQGIKGDKGDTGNAGLDGDRYSTTSSTSITLGNFADLTLYTTDLNLDYSIEQTILIAHADDKHMHGQVISYNPATGELHVHVTNHTGSGTFASWQINLDGAIGIQGPQGIQGETGPAGAQGDQGIQGIQGIQGEQGLKGDTGNTGATGSTGATGAQGIQGIQGIQGETGPAGAGTGPWTLIGTYQATSGFFSSFTGLNGAYKEIILTWSGATCSSNNGLLGNSPRVWVNGNASGFTGGNDYATPSSSTYMISTSSGLEPNLTYRWSSGKLHIRNANSTGTKQWDMVVSGALPSYISSSVSFQTFQGSGTITQTSAINTINFQIVSESWTGGTWNLWGVA
jgi:hypothetical protein